MAILQALVVSSKRLLPTCFLRQSSPIFHRNISKSDRKKDSQAVPSEPIGDVKKFENWNVPEVSL